MRRLIYTSKAGSTLSRNDVRGILVRARKHNARANVTGLIIHHSDRFFQVLEGEEAAVNACYARIRRDTRHYNCIMLADRPVFNRMFTDNWLTHCPFDELGPSQQKQLSQLAAIAEDVPGTPLTEDLKVNALLLALLAGFQALELAG